MQTKQLWAASLLSTLLLSACQVDDLPAPDSGELYTRDFIKTFGLFDSRHDWNMASAATVTVTTANPTDISVCARIDGTLYEFATFLRVEGSKTLDVDIPKGTSQLIVRAGGRDYNVAVGGSLDLATRTYFEAEVTPGTLGVRRAKAQYDIVKYGSYVAKYAEILPEGKGNLNRENISLNFRFKQLDDQEIVIYPVLWNTSNTNTLGIYYTDADGQYHEQDVYRIKDGDFLRRRSYDPANDVMDKEEWISSLPRLGQALKELNLSTDMTEFTPEQKAQVLQKLVDLGWRATGDDLSLNPQPPTLYLPGDTYEGVKLGQNRVRIKGTRWTWASMQGAQITLDAGQHDNDHTIYETSGIVVTIPKGVEYGMYIRRADGQIRYSESSKNPKSINYYYKYDGDAETPPEKVMLDYYYNCPYAATFTREDLVDYGTEDQVSTFRRVCFEDWLASESSDHDLNDMVFYIGGVRDEEVIEGDNPQEEAIPYTWIIACEDLGDNDFDFNDVVFGVSKPITDDAGIRTVKIRPMAAGGTLPLYLCYDGKRIVPEGNTANGEFHSWFKGHHTSSTVINAGGYSAVGQSVTIQVKSDFTLACCLNVEGGNMGGFTVEVEGTDHRVITAPDLGASISEAPQMICVPVTWYWPTERTHILEPYPKFKDWCADMNTHTEWHKEAESGNVVRHNYATSSGSSSPDPTPAANELKLTSTGNIVWDGNEYKVEIPSSIDLSNATSLRFNFSGLQSSTSGTSFWTSSQGQDSFTALTFYSGATSLTVTDADVISRLAQSRTFYYVFWNLTDTPTITIDVTE